MASSTSSYVLTLPLQTRHHEAHILEKRFEIARKIYNACLAVADKRLRVMQESKDYQKARKLPSSTPSERKLRSTTFRHLHKRFKLEEYALHTYVKSMQTRFKHLIDSHTAQKLASRAFHTVKKKQIGMATKVSFKGFGKLNSVEGKTNAAGIRYKDRKIYWLGLELPVRIKPKDDYAFLALESRVKYSRILRTFMKGTIRYQIQLILEGTPPQKYNQVGIKGKLGKGRVGIDIGTQTAAIVSDSKASLVELAPSVIHIQKEIRLIQRSMDRSRRAMNPEKFNKDGTINRSSKKWVHSKRYGKLKATFQEINRLLSVYRKQDHCLLANQILEQGDEFFIETMNFQALQKRAKETTRNKNGRFSRKKRFGKSIARKAPSMLITILEQKLSIFGIELKKINTSKVKASQYHHETDTFQKKSLSERWNLIRNERVQRDLYSAYLIKNVTESLDSINRYLCMDEYDHFKKLHDIEIIRIKSSNQNKISSFGI
ncbi:transposase [Bacillus sp. FJAT-49705]|uniref:Transposase n=3 Tax=Cytobacillus citreus TaxID=2833586 RepID=A0ABS5NQW0_9BACI|nr:transposase [Cytobacillus citreus]MBS4189343.1 transposase [Cytobacillus citreus]MBS4190210.1 transposase [Cytobacillus citreus]